jgi:hypothetical protein
MELSLCALHAPFALDRKARVLFVAGPIDVQAAQGIPQAQARPHDQDWPALDAPSLIDARSAVGRVVGRDLFPNLFTDIYAGDLGCDRLWRDRHIRQCRPFARKIRISATSEQAFAISELPRLSHSSARAFSHSTSPDDSGASARSASRIAASRRHSPASSASPISSSRRARFRSRSPSIVGNVRRGHGSAKAC